MSDTQSTALTGAQLGVDARWEVRAWLMLGVAALAIAGVFALMLAVSRVPGTEDIVPWPPHFFEKGLVIETSGPEDEVVKILAPLTTPDETLREGLRMLEESAREVLQERSEAQIAAE